MDVKTPKGVLDNNDNSYNTYMCNDDIILVMILYQLDSAMFLIN